MNWFGIPSNVRRTLEQSIAMFMEKLFDFWRGTLEEVKAKIEIFQSDNPVTISVCSGTSTYDYGLVYHKIRTGRELQLLQFPYVA